MARIHRTAVVEEGAELAEDVEVGPFCYVGRDVSLGPGTRLISHVTILGRTKLGAGNTVFPQAVLGAVPQDLKYRGEDSQLIIGDHNVIREAVTIHLGTANGGGLTQVGSHNLIMVGAHIAHDCIIGDHVIIANAVQLAGHVKVEDRANIGGATAAHHYVTFGRLCFVGGMSRITQDVPPFMICEGNPARVRGPNVIGMERAGLRAEEIQEIKEAYRLLYQEAEGPLSQRVERLLERFPESANIRLLCQFLQATARGVFGRQREADRPDPRHRRPGAAGRNESAAGDPAAGAGR